MYIQKIKFVQTSNLSAPSIFKHYTHTPLHPHQTKIITEVPHTELQLPHCKDTIASQKK